jgi:2-polyprenyl-3-methyl-5-hydroxy-6-metoxy-1,4-benzoquinol methylase
VSNLPKKFGPDVEVRVGLPTEDPWSLPFAHKAVLAEKMADYDLFIYSEDDHLITAQNIAAFREMTEVLADDELPGFIACESDSQGNLNYCGVHKNFHWDPLSVKRAGKHVFAQFTNEHSACYLLTRKQLQKAMESGGFLVPPHAGKYDLACSASTDPYTQCGFKKLICISDLPRFSVRHLTNKYFGKEGIDNADMARQVRALLEIAEGARPAWQFMQSETRLPVQRFSKSYYEPPQPQLLDQIPPRSKSVLSVGCGWAAAESVLIKRGVRVIGIPLDSVIGTCAEAAGVEVAYRDPQRAFDELPGGPFDAILLSNVLHLLETPDQLLSRASRVLAPNGKIVAAVPNLSRLPIVIGRLSGDHRYRQLGRYNEAGVHVTSRSVLRHWFQSAGLRVEKIIDLLSSDIPRSQKWLAKFGDGFFASEFVVVAHK